MHLFDEACLAAMCRGFLELPLGEVHRYNFESGAIIDMMIGGYKPTYLEKSRVWVWLCADAGKAERAA